MRFGIILVVLLPFLASCGLGEETNNYTIEYCEITFKECLEEAGPPDPKPRASRKVVKRSKVCSIEYNQCTEEELSSEG